MEVLEHHEKIGHAGGHGGEHGTSQSGKRIGLLIAVLAAALAVCETGGKSAQTAALNANVEASNLWAFYQAKTIRRTSVQAAAEAARLGLVGEGNAERRAATERQLADWDRTIARYESEPEAAGGRGEGRKELVRRAGQAEGVRDERLSAYHMFEFGSAAFQLAIVLASAAVITGLMALAWTAGGLGLIGVALAALGYVAPTLIHL